MNAKYIAYLVVGVIAGVILANDLCDWYNETPAEQVTAEQTILGHRIGPGGVEMLVVKNS